MAFLPNLGYNRRHELRDDDYWADYNLPSRTNKVKREYPKELVSARYGGDSDGIHFEMVIGTDENQMAITPGNLLKSWKENNRNYFHYKRDIHIVNG